MEFKIKTLRKKRGGVYYVVLSYDEYDLPRIWGRFKSKVKARQKIRELKRRFGKE